MKIKECDQWHIKYAKLISQTCYKFCQSYNHRIEQDDLESEVMIKLYTTQKRKDINIHTSEQAFVHILIKNTCIDYLRRQSKDGIFNAENLGV